MKTFLASTLSLSIGLCALAVADDARACGGCFTIQQSEGTQVTGHRMILSVSNAATTLWDQIEYSGAPESFAWVLPIHGQVDVGVSSDALFGQLAALTDVQILSPAVVCPPPGCPGTTTFTMTSTSSTGGGGGVTVLAQETVGPYETVQLASSDPQALQDWLDAHGYALPPEIAPLVADYVADGFDFLAMKLVPGQGISSMQPVRVTSSGAGLGLPLRMVAAGTGATTPITLWIAGEGRYEPANFPSFTIDPAKVVWDWDTQSSNYSQLKQLAFDASGGKGWLVEAASPIYAEYVSGPLLYLAQYQPEESGYDADPATATELANADLDALFGTLDQGSLWLTRLHAELPKAALATDLLVGAAASQTEVSPIIYVSQSVGKEPECPPPPDCGDTGTTGAGGGGGAGSAGSGGSGAGSGGGCAMGGSETGLGIGGALLALGLLGARRRRRRD